MSDKTALYFVCFEEFVNHFDQQYPQPNEAAFAIQGDSAQYPFSENTWIAREGIQARDVPDHRRKDATFAFVINTSGSMSKGNRLELVKHALRFLVRGLRPTYPIGFVTYGDRGHAILNPTEARHDERTLEVIDRLYQGGYADAELRRYHADRVGGILHKDPEVTELARLVGMTARMGDG